MMSSNQCNNVPDHYHLPEKNFLIATLKAIKCEETPVNIGEQCEQRYSAFSQPLILPSPYGSSSSSINIPFTQQQVDLVYNHAISTLKRMGCTPVTPAVIQARLTIGSDIILSGLFYLIQRKIEIFGTTQIDQLNVDVTLCYFMNICGLCPLELLNNEGEEIKAFNYLISRNAKEEWKRIGFVIVLKSYIVNKVIFPSFYAAIMKFIHQYASANPEQAQQAVNFLTQLIMKDFKFKN